MKLRKQKKRQDIEHSVVITISSFQGYNTEEKLLNILKSYKIKQ